MCHSLLPIACWITLRAVLVATILLISALALCVVCLVRKRGDVSGPHRDAAPEDRWSAAILPIKLLLMVALVVIGATVIQNLTGALRQIVGEVPAQVATPQR